MSKIAVFLDDQFLPETIPPYVDEWMHCKSVSQFIDYVSTYFLIRGKFPELLALTHDLCDEHVLATSIRHPSAPIFYSKFKTPTGMEAVKWLIEFSKQKNTPIGRVALHGDNEKGKANMMYELQQHKKETEDPIPAFTMSWKLKRI